MSGARRRRLWPRVAVVVGAVLVVEFALFVASVNSVRREVLTIGYRSQLTLLADAGALDRCDADPAGFTLPDRGFGRVIPLRPDGTPWAAGERVGDLGDAVARATPGEVVRVGTPMTAWPAVVRVDRAGPCSLFYMAPPRVSGGVPLLRVLALRALLALAIVGAILLLVVRPLSRRIGRLAGQTAELARADLVGRVDEGPDELGAIGAVINEASRRARALIDAEVAQREALHALFADLAHDVRTPLASVKLSTDALVRGDDPATVARALRAEVEYLDALFANLATLARLRHTSLLPVERREGDLRPLVEHVRDRFAPLARDARVALEVGLPDGPVMATFDALTLEQALGNVVHNAVKYAREHIAVVLVAAAAGGEIRVLDDGPGVEEGERAHLTERGFRGAHQDGVSGVGLGLAISDAILARHDGSLEIERLPEGGTRVTVRVPSRPDATGRGAAREAAAV